MKSSALLISGFLFLILLTGGNSYGQENLEKEKQKDLKQKKQIIEKQKQLKELDSLSKNSQAASEDELKFLFEQQKKTQTDNDDWDVILRDATRQSIRNSHRSVRTIRGGDNATLWIQPDFGVSGSGDNTTFTISKKLKDATTFSSDFEYEVPENVEGLSLVFSSELEAGGLKLTITKPNGKVFQVFSVAPVANVDWNKQFKIKEGESKDYSGTWKITISTKEAKGYYELNIISY